MEEKKELKFDVKRLFNYEKLHEYDEDGQKGFLGYLIREEQWKIENDRIVLSNYTLLNLHSLIVNHNEREHTSEEDRFISTFLKYYNDDIEQNKDE